MRVRQVKTCRTLACIAALVLLFGVASGGAFYAMAPADELKGLR